jgi:hypothetical protein
MKLLLHILITLFPILCYAQSIVKIEGFGQINCPKNMEVQGGAYKEYVDNVKEINGISASKVILQQKGLNGGNGGLDTYARVMIRISFGDFNPLTTPITESDANDVNEIFESQIKNKAYSNNAVILYWSKAIATTLNGYKAVRFGYKRKIGSNPVVTVSTFLIQNTDRMYSITFENRTDNYNWADTFATIMKSLSIIKQ